jgi:hypothetical protein
MIQQNPLCNIEVYTELLKIIEQQEATIETLVMVNAELENMVKSI